MAGSGAQVFPTFGGLQNQKLQSLAGLPEDFNRDYWPVKLQTISTTRKARTS
jgi:hypothetical protein